MILAQLVVIMAGKISGIKPIKHWTIYLCALFLARLVLAADVPIWTDVYWGINGWTNISPALQITSASDQYVTISWASRPEFISDFTLETTSNLENPVWNPISATGITSTTTLSKVKTSGYAGFFKLKGPAAYIPLFSFAIFYNKELEFTWAAPMLINGPVHANGPIYTGVGSTSSLTYNSTVTTSSTITNKSLGGYQVSQMTGPITYNGNPPFATNTLPLMIWTATNSLHGLIEMPPPGEDPSSDIGMRRFFNQAGMVLLISNTTVSAILRADQNDIYPSNIVTDINNVNVSRYFPFLTITNTFYDGRESKTVKATQIDVGLLKSWAVTNTWFRSKLPFGGLFWDQVIYVADCRTVTASQMTAVRLFNAAQLPNFTGSLFGSGFTLATLNPLYIWGNYNCPNPADLGTTNTASTLPSALICDALTILSPSWMDASSTASLGSRNPSATTINAAVIAGSVYTTGTDYSTFSGGVHNLMRLLEDWNTGIRLTINGSLVNLYSSQIATNQFQLPGVYYNAPSRRFSFDPNFYDPAKMPPFTPLVRLYPSTGY